MALHRARHVAFITTLDAKRDSIEHVMTEHLRVSGVYWGLAALTTLGAHDALDRAEVLALVRRCACEGGGYAGNAGHDAHVLYTLSALQLLALCDALDEAPHPRDVTAAYLSRLQRSDGSFAGDEWGEIDTRFTYCALQAAALLRRLDALDVPAAARYVASCRNFDGGFGAVPGAESHAGQVFCCVGALAIAGALDEAHVDADALGWWLAERQVDSGGLNGRPEKQSDVCYSWWILSALAILGRVDWIDGDALSNFILECQDPEGGGFADRPGNCADVFHTFFGIAALSLLDKLPGLVSRGGGQGEAEGGAPPPPPVAIDPIYALPAALTARLALPRMVLDASPHIKGP